MALLHMQFSGQSGFLLQMFCLFGEKQMLPGQSAFFLQIFFIYLGKADLAGLYCFRLTINMSIINIIRALQKKIFEEEGGGGGYALIFKQPNQYDLEW